MTLILPPRHAEALDLVPYSEQTHGVPVSTGVVAEAMGVSRRVCADLMRALEEAGLVEMLDGALGRSDADWRLTAEGREYFRRQWEEVAGI